MWLVGLNLDGREGGIDLPEFRSSPILDADKERLPCARPPAMMQRAWPRRAPLNGRLFRMADVMDAKHKEFVADFGLTGAKKKQIAYNSSINIQPRGEHETRLGEKHRPLQRPR